MIITGGCYCGQVRYELDDSEVLLSAICHCTNCQKLTGGTAVHTIHVPETRFKFTGPVDSFSFVSKSRKHRKRCSNCGSQFASYNEDMKKWSIWGATIDKEDGHLPSSIQATDHMFYGTRAFDAGPGLKKWECYARESKQICQ